jgi:hypothetical protein
MSVATVMDRLRARAEDDPAFLDTLEYLASSEVADPFEVPPASVRRLARDLNQRRQEDRAAELRRRSLATSEVVDLVTSITDRKAVDRRRHRGTLLGISGIGRQTIHPRWQFDARRGDTYRGLADVLEALREVAPDPLDADAIATAPQPAVDGASIAALLADGDVETAVALARLAGDQS